MGLFVFVFTVLFIAALLLYNSFSWGLVVYKFWYWFTLPVFVELPEITYLQAVGLMFFIGLFQKQTLSVIKKEYRDVSTESTITLISPWTMLLMGWVIYKIFFV
jgi:hypothetical protein